jgi:hypothetical protein
VSDEEKPTSAEKFDPDKFGDKLRSNWDKKRKNRSNATANMRIIIWMVFLVLVLGFLCWKFLF